MLQGGGGKLAFMPSVVFEGKINSKSLLVQSLAKLHDLVFQQLQSVAAKKLEMRIPISVSPHRACVIIVVLFLLHFLN